jgi:hypothetical protein
MSMPVVYARQASGIIDEALANDLAALLDLRQVHSGGMFGEANATLGEDLAHGSTETALSAAPLGLSAAAASRLEARARACCHAGSLTSQGTDLLDAKPAEAVVFVSIAKVFETQREALASRLERHYHVGIGGRGLCVRSVDENHRRGQAIDTTLAPLVAVSSIAGADHDMPLQ